MEVARMQTGLQIVAERVDKDRVKLRVEVPEDRLDGPLEAAYRRWATEIKVPGFRKGKVPRQIIDTRVGVDVVREEALRDALPEFYREALKAQELEAIAPPEIDVVAFEPGSPLIFEAMVDIRPEIELPDLSSIKVDAPSSEVTDDDLNEQINRLRDRFAELETVGRDARRGDFVLIDLKGYHHDELVEGASAPDLLYEIGSRTGPPSLDEELEGNRPGAILKFTDAMPEGAGDLAGQDVSFTVLLKEVKTKKLPPADDAFAKTIGDFETLDALKADLKTRLADVKRGLVAEQVSGLVLDSLVDIAGFEPPEKLVEAEFEHRLSHFEDDLKKAGMTIEAYGRASQLTELEIRRDIRHQVARSVKAELLLEEVARREKIEVTEEDLGREIALAAARAERDPKEVAEQLMASGRLGAVAADIMRRKALDLVVERADVSGMTTDDGTGSLEEALPDGPH